MKEIEKIVIKMNLYLPLLEFSDAAATHDDVAQWFPIEEVLEITLSNRFPA